MTRDGWVVRLPATRILTGVGPLVAVKDAIDVAGLPTVVGSPAVALAHPDVAAADAACVATVRAAGGVVVGKTAATELCWFANGLNVHEPAPVNPLDPTRVPGGSSSGSAVVVACGEVDVALGTDTGGSVRIPAACCGIAGLKTTWGRIPLTGVWPLSPSLDTVGPLARDVAGLELGMRLLDPAYAPTSIAAEAVLLRIRPAPVDLVVDPVVDAAVDAALAATGWAVIEVEVPWWGDADEIVDVVLTAEGARANAHLMAHRDRLSARVVHNITAGLATTDAELETNRARMAEFQDHLVGLLDGHGADAVALPTLAFLPPPPEASGGTTRLTHPVNVAGVPALALPVPVTGSHLPGSLQLVGRPYAEATLLALGAAVERAVAVSLDGPDRVARPPMDARPNHPHP